jgi:hypothetical protein
MARRFTPAGFSLLIIFLPTLGMFGDPLGGSFFGSEALDYFRLTVRPKDVKANASRPSCVALAASSLYG